LSYALPGYPNPTRGEATIAFGLAGAGGPVAVRVYAASGRLVRTLLDAALPAGYHAIRWDGRDDDGRPVASGVYLYRIQAPDLDERGRLAILR